MWFLNPLGNPDLISVYSPRALDPFIRNEKLDYLFQTRPRLLCKGRQVATRQRPEPPPSLAQSFGCAIHNGINGHLACENRFGQRRIKG